jgi:heme exporter protein CcmD
MTANAHAFYLWSAYGACGIAIALELWLLRRRRAQAREAVRQAIEEMRP